MKKLLKISVVLTLLVSLVVLETSCSKRGRDCKGRRKTAKTNMGGWL